MSSIIETERLLLRNWVHEDFHDFKAIATNPSVVQYIGTGEIWSDQRIKQFIDNNIALYNNSGFCFWALVDKASQALIGLCGLSSANSDEIEIGWWLIPERWGKGLTTEIAQAVMDYGFEQLNLPRITAIAHPLNYRSIRVMQKIGMQFEKMSVDRRGVEVVCYAKNKPDKYPYGN